MADDLDRQARKVAKEIFRTDPLLVAIARAMAPAVNAELEKLGDIESRRVKPQLRSYARSEPDRYCPGCGERSPAPNLCDECLALNADT